MWDIISISNNKMHLINNQTTPILASPSMQIENQNSNSVKKNIDILEKFLYPNNTEDCSVRCSNPKCRNYYACCSSPKWVKREIPPESAANNVDTSKVQ